MAKLTATAYDRWWRSRIEREETEYALHVVSNKQPVMKLNTLGAPQLVDLPASSGSAAARAAGNAMQRLQTGASSSGRLSACAPPAAAPAAPAAPQQVPTPPSAALSAHQQHQGSQQRHQQPAERLKAQAQSRQPQMPQKPAAPSMLRQALVQQQQQALSKVGSKVGIAAASNCADNRLKASSGAPRSLVSAAGSARSSRASSRPSTSGRSHSSALHKAADVEGGSVVSGFATPKSAVYPQTPNFSEVSASESEIMARLTRLEADLNDERQRRERAEAEMRTLLASRGGRS